MYEATSQLVFTAYLPRMERPSKSSLNATSELLNILLDEIKAELQIANKENFQIKRQKRHPAVAIVAGGAVLVAGGVSIGLLYSDLRNVKTYVDEVNCIYGCVK